MTIELNLVSFLLLLGISQGILQTIKIQFFSEQSGKNKYLVILLVTVSLLLAQYFVIVSRAYLEIPHFSGLSGPLLFALGPSLYLYIKSELDQSNFKYKDFFHSVPFFTALFWGYNYFGLTAEQKIENINYFVDQEIGFSWNSFIYTFLIIAQLFVYLVLSHRMVKRKESSLKSFSSNSNIIKFRWLKSILNLFLVYTIIFISVFTFWSIQSKYTLELEGVLALILSSFVFLYTFYASKMSIVNVSEVDHNSEEKYKTSSLTDEQADRYLEQVLDIMKSEKLYLNPDLRLPDLAKKLELSSHVLSQVINQRLETNFFDFVNDFRVKESKKRLASEQFDHLTILAIALDSGFNNKTTFNRIFKKKVGTTPSAYQKGVRESV